MLGILKQTEAWVLLHEDFIKNFVQYDTVHCTFAVIKEIVYPELLRCLRMSQYFIIFDFNNHQDTRETDATISHWSWEKD